MGNDKESGSVWFTGEHVLPCLKWFALHCLHCRFCRCISVIGKDTVLHNFKALKEGRLSSVSATGDV